MPTTIVTGASRGIGLVISEHLADLGHDVIGVARRAVDNFKGLFYTADLADESDAARVLSQILRDHSVDNLVSNAGLSRRHSLEDIPLSELREMMALNIQATVQCAQYVVPQMKARGKGRIVNVASRAMLGREQTSAYAATKAATEALTRSWAIELAEFGVTVNAVAPGAIASQMFERNNPVGTPERDKLMDRIPMHRLGQPREVASAIAYFLSDDAAYTTGQTLYICGGWSI